MSMLDNMLAQQVANRVLDVERRTSQKSIEGDFEGSVQGTWVRFDDNGGGVVSYKNKDYLTVIIGEKSIAPGTQVELTHANGIYFSDF